MSGCVSLVSIKASGASEPQTLKRRENASELNSRRLGKEDQTSAGRRQKKKESVAARSGRAPPLSLLTRFSSVLFSYHIRRPTGSSFSRSVHSVGGLISNPRRLSQFAGGSEKPQSSATRFCSPQRIPRGASPLSTPPTRPLPTVPPTVWQQAFGASKPMSPVPSIFKRAPRAGHRAAG